MTVYQNEYVKIVFVSANAISLAGKETKHEHRRSESNLGNKLFKLRELI